MSLDLSAYKGENLQSQLARLTTDAQFGPGVYDIRPTRIGFATAIFYLWCIFGAFFPFRFTIRLSTALFLEILLQSGREKSCPAERFLAPLGITPPMPLFPIHSPLITMRLLRTNRYS